MQAAKIATFGAEQGLQAMGQSLACGAVRSAQGPQWLPQLEKIQILDPEVLGAGRGGPSPAGLPAQTLEPWAWRQGSGQCWLPEGEVPSP